MLKLSKVKQKILLRADSWMKLSHTHAQLSDHHLRCQTQMVDGVLCLRVLNPQLVVVLLERERSVKTNKITQR